MTNFTQSDVAAFMAFRAMQASATQEAEATPAETVHGKARQERAKAMRVNNDDAAITEAAAKIEAATAATIVPPSERYVLREAYINAATATGKASGDYEAACNRDFDMGDEKLHWSDLTSYRSASKVPANMVSLWKLIDAERKAFIAMDVSRANGKEPDTAEKTARNNFVNFVKRCRAAAGFASNTKSRKTGEVRTFTENALAKATSLYKASLSEARLPANTSRAFEFLGEAITLLSGDKDAVTKIVAAFVEEGKAEPKAKGKANKVTRPKG